MISTTSRRLQQPLHMDNLLQLTLFLACILSTPNSSASTHTAAPVPAPIPAPVSAPVSAPEPASSIINTSWFVLVLVCIAILLSIYYLDKYKKGSSKEPSEKISLWGFLIFFLENNWLTISMPIILVSAGHYLIGAFLGHEPEGLVIAVLIIQPFENFAHRLLALPKEINQKVDRAIVQLDKAVMDAVPKSLEAKRFFVTGTPHRKSVDGMLEFIHEHEEFKDSLDGISIFLFDSKPSDYAKVCEHFLQKAKQVESMTDMDFDKLLPLFKNDNEEVMVWVNKVNDTMIPKTKNDIKIKIHRVLVLTGERKTFLGALENLLDEQSTTEIKTASKSIVESYSRLPGDGSDKFNESIAQFIEDAKAGLVNFKASYCCPNHAKKPSKPVDFTFNILAKESQEIGGIYRYSSDTNASYHDMLPRGEFIMFDRKYLVRFNSDAKLLEVLIGGILDEYAKVFSPSGNEKNFLLPFAHGDSFLKVELPLGFLYASGTQANGV